MRCLYIYFLLLNLHCCSCLTDQVTNEFIILIISQPHIYDLGLVHNILDRVPPFIPILYTHSYISSVTNSYAIYPLFPSILYQYSQMKWLFICDVHTQFNITNLIKFSEQSNDSYVGHGLYDSEPSIIHHYSLSFDTPYPDFSSGVLISRNILSLFVNRLKTYTKNIDFIIDVKYEFNQLVNDLTNTTLIDRPDLFCTRFKSNCLTWYNKQNHYKCQQRNIHLNNVYIAIKTFSAYHQTRVNLLRKTWLNEKLHYNLFTNELSKFDDNKNEQFIVTNQNTERGHCHKAFLILHFFYENKENFQYLIIADDDTLLSIPRVLRLMRCFMLTNDMPLVIGERYGYGDYYEYPTGGSGMIFNRQAVQQIISNCECPTPDTPDDMFLGLCLKRNNIHLIHVPEMHQAQPNAYSKDWLNHQTSISFHKFEGIDVEEVYRKYLHEELSPDDIDSRPIDEL